MCDRMPAERSVSFQRVEKVEQCFFIHDIFFTTSSFALCSKPANLLAKGLYPVTRVEGAETWRRDLVAQAHRASTATTMTYDAILLIPGPFRRQLRIGVADTRSILKMFFIHFL